MGVESRTFCWNRNRYWNQDIAGIVHHWPSMTLKRVCTLPEKSFFFQDSGGKGYFSWKGHITLLSSSDIKMGRSWDKFEKLLTPPLIL